MNIDFTAMKAFFNSGDTQSYPFRHAQLKKLRQTIEQHEAQILQALYNDLHKSAEEAYTTEIGFIYAEISHALKNLKHWMKPVKVGTPLLLFPSASKIIREPLGVTLLIAPWNYPFHLMMAPLIGAIAGGNCAVLKPSEYSSHTSRIIEEIISKTYPPEYITVVTGDGGVVVPQLMQAHRFDLVFFTGSIPVGREVAKLAAPQLTPTILELGGKSPCIVDSDVNIKVAAQRIVWGKFTNAGQTCVAPDYLLVHEQRKQQLVDEMNACIRQFYGSDPQSSPDYGRIINEKRFDTLEGYLLHGDVVTGGIADKRQLYISPTLMDNVDETQPMMQEEIFGPILPIFTYSQHQQALDLIKRHPDPLSLYVFTDNNHTAKMYTETLSFGGGCINNTLVHLGNAGLPFGGVKNSGYGVYHGKFSFEAFTHPKAIVKTGTWFDPTVKYPPNAGKLGLLKRVWK